MSDPIVRSDDPDAHVTYPITDAQGNALDYTPTVLVGTTEVIATWVGATTTAADGATTRDLTVPLHGIPPRNYGLWLRVPGDNDIFVGSVRIF